MAFEAGAKLTGMEHTRRTMLIKDANMPLLAITITRGGRMLDILRQYPHGVVAVTITRRRTQHLQRDTVR